MTMEQVPEGTAVSTQVNIMSNRKTVMLTKDAPLSSHLVNWAISSCLTSQASKLY